MPQPSARDFRPLLSARVREPVSRDLQSWLPARQMPAAVLIPVVERGESLHVLFTRRSAHLRRHAGQISFPGGRIEPSDTGPWQAALRETHEEIGLEAASIEFAGYLPDHLVGSGFRVTPSVGFVNLPLQLSLADGEVQEVFEVPLDHLFDEANHCMRRRLLGTTEIEFDDIRYRHRSIWGATAAILMTWKRLIDAQGRPG